MISSKAVLAALVAAVLVCSCSGPRERSSFDRSTGGYSGRSQSSSGSASKASKASGKKAKVGQVLHGEASYYGPGFEGKLTANGETFNSSEMTCAHKTLPFNTMLKVTRDDTGASVVVRVNDRGPYAKGRILDLSAGAGKKIGLDKDGHAKVTIEVIGSE